MDMNSVNITGRLTDAPTLRYTADGKAVANLRVAVNGRNDRVDFIDVTVWGKPAEAVAEHKTKGTRSASPAASPRALGPTTPASATSAPASRPTR